MNEKKIESQLNINIFVTRTGLLQVSRYKFGQFY